MKHSGKPHPPSDKQLEIATAKMKEVMASAYYQQILPLKQIVVGKIVSRSVAGTSGFILYFLEGDWIVTYLEEMKLIWIMGKGDPGKDLEMLINSSFYGNGYQPLSVDRPYARQICDIGAEISNAHGKEITGISIGARCFNYCFPAGMELDTTIVQTSDNKYALRVFWEQW